MTLDSLLLFFLFNVQYLIKLVIKSKICEKCLQSNLFQEVEQIIIF